MTKLLETSVLNCRVTLLPTKRDSKLRYHIDVPRDVQEISNNLFIQGWVIHKKQKIETISLFSAEGNDLGSTKPDIHRPGVYQIYSTFCNSKSTGFELTVTGLKAGEYFLTARIDDNQQIVLAELTLQENLKPKLLFMHIAKTAGSSVNK